jgi:hypothetical protein
MRWFTDDAFELESAGWQRILDDYAAHIDRVLPHLPGNLRALAREPQSGLHDAQILEIAVDSKSGAIDLLVEKGDERRKLHFEAAAIIPADLHRLAFAVESDFRASHWSSSATATEIRAQEVDVLGDGRYLLRLLLWPFHEFAIEFSSVNLVDAPAERGQYLRRLRVIAG